MVSNSQEDNSLNDSSLLIDNPEFENIDPRLYDNVGEGSSIKFPESSAQDSEKLVEESETGETNMLVDNEETSRPFQTNKGKGIDRNYRPNYGRNI